MATAAEVSDLFNRVAKQANRCPGGWVEFRVYINPAACDALPDDQVRHYVERETRAFIEATAQEIIRRRTVLD